MFDGINSHNGELSEAEFIPDKEKCELDFEDELFKCHTQKGYDRKMIPATIEGCLIRICDKMAYTPYDMLDRIAWRNNRQAWWRLYRYFDSTSE